MDVMVLKAQQWMNSTYGNDSRYTPVVEDGLTGWGTINGLIIALQIELNMAETAAVIGPTTRSLFNAKYPNGIIAQSNDDETTDNVHSIIQCALWCKGYYAETGAITGYFRGQSAASIVELKADMGFTGNSTVTLEIMECLLSMKQFVLMSNYGGKASIRNIQQKINREYKAYTGIIPCDGLYGREMNTAIIQVLQAIEGFDPSVCNGNFGNGTKGALREITVFNASNNPDWVWIASVALVCNNRLAEATTTWTTDFEDALRFFQGLHALVINGKLDTNTWMSLFISKGNPDRPAIACDTRFEITDALAQRLVADGYQIVGRYLTGGDFKEIRDGELERILDYGLKYFPIFQVNGTDESDFTYEIGKEHAKLAREAAIEHKVPSTVIYFAVDFDAMDYQVTSNIIPYFRGVSEHIGPLYEVGIYAPRNVCTRVCDAGYAVSSFVSDMSTGFSGNLGFPIPTNWNYDQFHEISGYGGNWDLDKVAYSGRIPACDSVDNHTIAGYVIPPDPNTTAIEHNIFEAIDIISDVENAYEEFKSGAYLDYLIQSNYMPQDVHVGVLNYLAKDYTSSLDFGLAVQTFDVAFEQFMLAEHTNLHNRVASYFYHDEDYYERVGRSNREAKTYVSNQNSENNVIGVNDVAHLAYSTLAYVANSLALDYWASWGGDLASGMSGISAYLATYPSEDVQTVANMFIGSCTDNLGSNYSIGCNYTDLCDDADAIGLSRIMEGKSIYTHLLSDSMEEYYNNLSTTKRYSQYQYDSLSFDSLEDLYRDLYTKTYVGAASILDIFKEGASVDVQIAACKAFANYIWTKIK